MSECSASSGAGSAPSGGLFRPEAIRHAKSKALGDVLSVSPAAPYLASGLAIVFLVALVALVQFGSYQRRVHVSGVLAPINGVSAIYSPRTGTVIERHVDPGQRVRKGQTLLTVTSDNLGADGRSAEGVVSAMIAERRELLLQGSQQNDRQLGLQAQRLQLRMTDLEDDIERTESQIELQRTRLAIAVESHRSMAALMEQGFVSSTLVQEKLAAKIDQEQRMKDLHRALASARRLLAEADVELKTLQLQSVQERTSTKRAVSLADQDLAEQSVRAKFSIPATTDGVVSWIMVSAGQSLTPTAPIAAISPEGEDLFADLTVPSQAIGFIEPGSNVRLRYKAFPFQKYGQYEGKVIDVSGASIPISTANVPDASAEAVYRVRVALNRQTVDAGGRSFPLRAGMMVDATVLLERRSLLDWIVSPINRLTSSTITSVQPLAAQVPTAN